MNVPRDERLTQPERAVASTLPVTLRAAREIHRGIASAIPSAGVPAAMTY